MNRNDGDQLANAGERLCTELSPMEAWRSERCGLIRSPFSLGNGLNCGRASRALRATGLPEERRAAICSRRSVGSPLPLRRGFAFDEDLCARFAVQGGPAAVHHNPRALAQPNDCQVVLLVELGDPRKRQTNPS
jgi:hypothetical protein